jgi:cell wall-associated NlpC family hydrolase
MSSGLVATMGLPAQAASDSATASVPVSGAKQAGTTAGATSAAETAPLTASATAEVSFDKGSAFKAKRASSDDALRKARQQAALRASRSSVRSTSVHNTSVTTGGASVRGSAVLAIAARYLGMPYRSGGSAPPGFDCSGYTQWVFGQLGVRLPRTANQQLGATRRIPRSEAQPGDLVFFISGGSAYHVGIYAGDGAMYDSPRSGKSVQKRDIWSASVVFGQVI